MRYYGEVTRLADKYGTPGGHVIDVGGHETTMLEELNGYTRRVLIDLRPVQPRRDIEIVQTDFPDPLDEAKLARWTERVSVESKIVADARERLIAVYRNAA